MKNMKKTVFTLVLVCILACLTSLTAFADTATKEDYIATNTDQKEYYDNTYRPVYAEYKSTISSLRNKIKETNFETLEDAEKTLSFLKKLVDDHRDFYGDRTTVGKSRYEVPKLRTAMYKAADEDKDYATAIDLCKKLKVEVSKRVGYMQGVMNQISAHIETMGKPATPSTPASSNVTLEFIANDVWSDYSFGFDIIVKNTTNQPISNWNISIGTNISISPVNVWTDGGYMSTSFTNNKLSISPFNQWQEGYTIPAKSSITLHGSANANAKDITLKSATFNGSPVSISYKIF